MVEDNKSREKAKSVDQKKKDERRQSMQQNRGKRVSGDPYSRHTLGQREYLALAQRWLPMVGQRHFAHRPYVGPTGWHNVGPTRVCTTLPLGQCGCYTCFHWANVGPTWVCTTFPLGQCWANIIVFSLDQCIFIP